MKTTSRVALAALTAAALASTTLPADGAPASSRPPSATTAPADVATLTLITGDRVTVTSDGHGEPAYVVEPAPEADREGVTFSVNNIDDATYIVPSDVADLTGAKGVLDLELFNVTRLVAERLDDAHTDSLPVIVQRADGEAPRGVEGLASGDVLDVLGAHVAELDKADTPDLGAEITDAGTTAVSAADRKAAAAAGSVVPRTQLDERAGDLAGVSRIWLNGETTAADWDANLTQIGAPAAWNDGFTGDGVKVAVLDTGIDAAHPDLAGQVVATANFSTSPSMTDVKGHGTHVAGTIAGTGAKAPGVRQGVAPGVDLLIGKVLGDDGRGDLAASVQGMEWAVENGARIVNMSLGSGPTDGTDPTSLALNELSAQSGTLFVVAAGNEGTRASMVSSPSTAEAALSVAAVDATGTVAGFSSRGPRVGDNGLKPELSAPGVAITAPRSSAMPGAPADYATFSGTSMATPHVAGVAAMLAQRHPDWTGQQIKAVLMGTAAPATGTLAEVGAGQASATAALAADVVPGVGNIHANLRDSDTTVTREVTYTNTGSSPTTVQIATKDGGDAAGVLSASPAELTLVPGGTGTVTVALDASKVSMSAAYSGSLTATPDHGPALATPVTATRARWLTASAVTTTGAPAAGAFVAILNHDNGSYATGTTGRDGTVRVSLTPGRLSVTATIQEFDGTNPTSSIVTTEVPAGDDTVTLDAATAVPAGAEVRGTTREEMALIQLIRVNEKTKTLTSNGLLAGGAYGPITRGQLRVSPSTANTPADTLRFDEHWVLANEDSDNRVGDASTVYDLVYDRRSIPADPVHRLGKRDVERLAEVDTEVYAPGVEHRSQMGAIPSGAAYFGLNTLTPSFVKTPRELTRYVTADGVSWAQFLYRTFTVTGGSLSMDLKLIRREYDDRRRYEESFWGGPLGAFGAGALTTSGATTTLSTAFDEMVDKEGQPGRYAEFAVPQRGTFSSKLYRDGVEVRNGAVDGRPARYRFVRAYDGKDVFPIGGQVATTWETEKVGATPDGTVALPLVNLRWDAPGLDLSNRARAGRDLTVRVRATSAALNKWLRWFKDADASWTTDGGGTWTPVRASRDGIASFRFTVPGKVLTSGTWVGLRFHAVDAAGNSIDQKLGRSFPVR